VASDSVSGGNASTGPSDSRRGLLVLFCAFFSKKKIMVSVSVINGSVGPRDRFPPFCAIFQKKKYADVCACYRRRGLLVPFFLFVFFLTASFLGHRLSMSLVVLV
jgi:hypothetical protein